MGGRLKIFSRPRLLGTHILVISYFILPNNNNYNYFCNRILNIASFIVSLSDTMKISNS